MQSSTDGFPQETGNSSRPSFAVVLTWPELPNAEYEVVQRICRVADNIGAVVWVVDNDGYPLRSNQAAPCPKRRLTRDDCDFVLSLHFESPRFYDIPSYTALWNPPDFYLGFGYGRTIEQLASHTDLLSCRSDVADAHAANVYEGLGRALQQPLPRLFHGVPRPYLEPRQDETSRLFYVGVNWERVTGEKGRHHELLQQLDAEDLIRIYGPEQILGVAPWRGFSTYRGSIPFDGESVVARINEAGICLALSSNSHQTSGIMSNRLFEALAGGAVIIANPHPFITKHFSDVVHIVDDRAPVEQMVAQIRNLILQIRADPQEARARARLGQQRLAERFSLEDNFRTLFAVHEGRLAYFKEQTLGRDRHEVSVILDATGAEPAEAERVLASLSAQVSVSIDLLVLAAPDFLERMQANFGPAIRSTQLFPVELRIFEEGKLSRRSAASGPAFVRALAAVQTSYFCAMQADDDCFSDHLATLAHKLDQTPDSSFACSGKLEEQLDKKGIPRRRFVALTFEHLEALAEAAYPRDAGRFLFRSTLIAKLPQAVFGLLDTFEYRLLMLWAFLDGPLAQTHYASYLRILDVTAELPAPFFSVEQQKEVIRDTVRGRSDWLALVSTLRQFRLPAPVAKKMPTLVLGRTYAMRKEGNGLALIRQGFSAAEDTGIWMDGREASIAFEVAGSDGLREAEIVLFALGRVAREDGAPQRCSVIVNGQVAGQIVVGTQPAQFRIPVPATTDLHSDITVTLRLRHADQVMDGSGKLLDDRRLGLHLVNFAMESLSGPLAPSLTLDHFYGLQQGGDGIAFVAEGFSPPEAEVVWMHGPEATLTFTPEVSGQRLELSLIGMGQTSQGQPAPRSCTFSLDGRVVGQVLFSGQMERRTIFLPAIYGGRSYRLTMDLRDETDGSVALQQFGLFHLVTENIRLARPIGPRRLLGAIRTRLRRHLR